MVETVRYTKIFMEDLDLGLSTKNIRLGNQATYPLSQIHLTKFLSVNRFVVHANNWTGQTAMVLPAFLPANRRIWGVTVKNLVAPGATNGLTGYVLGDVAVADRWSNAPFPLTALFESDEGDFADTSLMIYPVAADVLLTGLGGTWDAVGQIEVAVHTSVLRHPS